MGNAVLAGADSVEHGDGVDRPLLLLMKEKGVRLVPTYSRMLGLQDRVTDPERLAPLRAYLHKKREELQLARELEGSGGLGCVGPGAARRQRG